MRPIDIFAPELQGNLEPFHEIIELNDTECQRQPGMHFRGRYERDFEHSFTWTPSWVMFW